MERVTLSLEPDQKAVLDDAADKWGTNRSEAGRRILAEYEPGSHETPTESYGVPTDSHDHPTEEYEELLQRVSELETAVFGTEGSPQETVDEPDETQPLADRVRDQLPARTTDAEADAIVAVVEFLRDAPEGYASPKEIRNAVQGEYHAGSTNAEYWWRDKIKPLLDHVNEAECVHQRRVEWAGAE